MSAKPADKTPADVRRSGSTKPTAETPQSPLAHSVPDPPRPHRWFLLASIVALAVWTLFLAWMALAGR